MTNAEKMKLAIKRLEEAQTLIIDSLGDLDFVQEHLILIDTIIEELSYYRLEELENEQNG